MDYWKLNSEHKKRLVQYSDSVALIFERYEKKIIKEIISKYMAGGFDRLKDNKRLEKELDREIKKMLADVSKQIGKDITAEWQNSENNSNALMMWAVENERTRQTLQKVTQEQRNKAVQAFIDRKRNGMCLSERIWNLSGNEKEWLESVLQYGIENGISAVELARDIRKFANTSEYIPTKAGTGMKTNHTSLFYAQRLARTETNIAYRTADHNKWSQMDFVLGIQIQLSDRHIQDEKKNIKGTEDICDRLQGIYPKTFKFTGWHPNCRCFATPVLQSEADFRKGKEAKPITDLPTNFEEWLAENRERIETASTLPYFIKDNFDSQLNYKN